MAISDRRDPHRSRLSLDSNLRRCWRRKTLSFCFCTRCKSSIIFHIRALLTIFEQVMGLILVLLTLAAAGLAPIRYRTPAINLAHKLNLLLVMLLSVAVVITAFLDISSISICATQFLPQAIFVFIGFLLAIPYLTVLGAVAMEMGLKRWFVGREVAGARDGVGNEKGVGKEVEVEMGYKVGDVKVGQIEGVASIIGGTHNSISKPISGGRLS